LPHIDAVAPAQAQVADQVFILDPNVIKVGSRWRSRLDREGLEKMKESVRVFRGVKVPISVRRIGEEWHLVAGQNRLNACLELELTEIPVREETGTDDDALRWEISENLHRIDLTELERSQHLEKWIQLTAGHNPEVSQVGTRAAARKLNMPKSTVARLRKIAKLPEETQQEAVALGLDDNQRALEAAATEKEPAAQKERLREHAVKPRKAPTPKPAKLKPSRLESVTLDDLAAGNRADLKAAADCAAESLRLIKYAAQLLDDERWQAFWQWAVEENGRRSVLGTPIVKLSGAKISAVEPAAPMPAPKLEAITVKPRSEATSDVPLVASYKAVTDLEMRADIYRWIMGTTGARDPDADAPERDFIMRKFRAAPAAEQQMLRAYLVQVKASPLHQLAAQRA
jgi:ParB/RepB/Spo0J family partition protein